ncbi:MAG: HD domain-containing phosphohydrolase, partial [candidate division WOR-3 bacterium]
LGLFQVIIKMMQYFEDALRGLLHKNGIGVKNVKFFHKVVFSDMPEVALDSTATEPIVKRKDNNVLFIKWPNFLSFEESDDPEKLEKWIKAHVSFVDFVLDMVTYRFSLESVTGIIRHLADVKDYYEVYSRIIENICHLTSSTVGALTVYDKTSNMVYGKGSGYVDRSLHGDVDVENVFVFSLTPDTAASKAAELKDVLVINDVSQEQRILKSFVEYYKVERVVVIPLFVENELFGFIYLGRFKGYPEFHPQEVEILRMILPYLLSVLRLLKYQEDSVKKLKALLFVKTISEDILSETNLFKIFDIAKDYVKEILKFENIAFLSAEDEKVNIIYYYGFSYGTLEVLNKNEDCLVRLLRKKESSGEEFECFGQDTASRLGYKSLSAISISVDDRPGVVMLIGSRVRGVLTGDEIEFLKVIANSLGVALKNLYLYEKSIEALDKIIEMLSQLESKKDYFTATHSKEVAEFAVKIARAMNLPEEEIKNIYIAGLLHDLGKVVVEKAILLKSAPLSSEEWKEIRSHPHWGSEILENIPGLEVVAKYVESHHERFDGTGYPNGLKGESIPLGGRILSLADAVVTMMSNRPYRSALNKDQVVYELIKEKGKQFDPYLVDIVIKILETNFKSSFN